jgi:hypothetical protein
MKKITSLFASVALMLFLMFVFSTQTAFADCTFSGTVQERFTNIPVSGIIIEAYNRAHNPRVVGDTTDSNGYYQFTVASGSSYEMYSANTPSGYNIWYELNGALGGDTYTFYCPSGTNTYTLNWKKYLTPRTIYGNLIDDDTQGGIANRTIKFTLESNPSVYTNVLTDSNGNFSFTIDCGAEYTVDGIESGGDNILTTHYSSTYTGIGCEDADNNMFLGFISFD